MRNPSTLSKICSTQRNGIQLSSNKTSFTFLLMFTLKLINFCGGKLNAHATVWARDTGKDGHWSSHADWPSWEHSGSSAKDGALPLQRQHSRRNPQIVSATLVVSGQHWPHIIVELLELHQIWHHGFKGWRKAKRSCCTHTWYNSSTAAPTTTAAKSSSHHPPQMLWRKAAQ